MSEAAEEKDEGGGVPAWVMTFADLMTLLMCFFVLLLAFSEMDVEKFKQLSGSMKQAFGVQADIEVKSIPKGTSLIAREFSPGRPDPTAMPTVRQFTVDSNKNTLDALSREAKELEKARERARRLRIALKEEIKKGDVSIQTEGRKIIIRIMENASFDSGLSDLRPEFRPVLDKISSLIDDQSGDITISGHTDNLPIRNERFRSNWDLSTSRAVSVAHAILAVAPLSPENVMVTGHADTRPRAANDTAENRAKNRRVEISIVRGAELDRHSTMSLDEGPATAAQPTVEATTSEETANESE